MRDKDEVVSIGLQPDLVAKIKGGAPYSKVMNAFKAYLGQRFENLPDNQFIEACKVFGVRLYTEADLMALIQKDTALGVIQRIQHDQRSKGVCEIGWDSRIDDGVIIVGTMKRARHEASWYVGKAVNGLVHRMFISAYWDNVVVQYGPSDEARLACLLDNVHSDVEDILKASAVKAANARTVGSYLA